MPLSLQEVSDRLEIQDLVNLYAELIDSKRFDALRGVFTEDAHIDYTATGGQAGDLDSSIEFLTEALAGFPHTQHLMGNIQIRLDGDEASGRVMCFNPMNLRAGERTHQFFIGLWYVDDYVRTEQGWRIRHRRQEKSWDFNAPYARNPQS